LLDEIVDRIEEIEEAYQRIRQLRETVKPLMSINSEYNVKYWMAAYILYPKASELIEKIKKFKKTHLEMAKPNKAIKQCKEEKEKVENKIKFLERQREYASQDIEELLSDNLVYYLSASGSELEDMIWHIATDYYEEYYKPNQK